LIDPRTGYIDRAWYLFFLSLNNVATSVIDDSGITFSAESIIASYEAALQALAQEVETQPLPVDLSAELIKQIQAAGLEDCCSSLLSQVAELQKQIEALTVLPPSLLGSVTSVGLSLPTEFTVTDSPVTSSGTLTATWVSQTAKYFFAAPNAANGTPSFRAIVASDIPALNYVSSVTGTSPVASSGGLTPAISLDSGYGDTQNPYAAKTANYVLAGPTSGASAVPTFRALVAADIPTLSYVTAVSVVSANGLAGTSSGGATPALTLSTSVTGILKGNGTAISAAVANTDYMGVGAPVTKTADFTVANGEIWYINNKSGSTCTVTLPAASSWTGRTLTFKNMQAQTLVSASSNVVPIDSTSAGTAILLAVVGNWATMVSDGTNWIIMQQAANNCLLLE
jgi:hypothetical protein